MGGTVPVERHTDFRQEYLQVLAAQFLLRRNADLLEGIATPGARICVDSRKRIIIIPGFEVRLFLLDELGSRPRDDRYSHMNTGTRIIQLLSTDRLIDAA